MDPFTHALLGASAGLAIFGKRLGRKAAYIGALGGILPDADIFISSKTDPLLAIEFHRYFTHSLFFAPAGAFIVALLWFAQKRYRAVWLPIWLCAIAGYFSHCLLDSATTYGTVLFWPLTRMRVAWDWIAIVDPIATAFLISGLVTAWRRKSIPAARIGLLFFLAYVGWGIAQHARALNMQATVAQNRGHQIVRTEAMPTIGNNLVWRSLYEADGNLYSDRIRVGWISKPTITTGQSLPLLTSNSLTAAEAATNKRTRAFERFSWFSSGWVARAPTDPTILGDMRYSLETEMFDPIWGIRFHTNENTPDSPGYEWVNRSRQRKLHLNKLWNEIVGRSESSR